MRLLFTSKDISLGFKEFFYLLLIDLFSYKSNKFQRIPLENPIIPF